jgi:hypothetical protein
MPDDSFPDDPAAGSSPEDPFGDFREAFEEGGPDPAGSSPDVPGAADLDPSLVLELARSWVREHQNATMLGAFAVGVFVGSLLRK